MPMKLRIIDSRDGHELGSIIEPDMPDVARLLILRGIAVPIEDEPAPEPLKPPNKMMQPQSVRRK